MREITINKNDCDQRLDKFLFKTLPSMPASLVQKSIRKGRVRINGKKITDAKHRLNLGDLLSLYINDEFFEEKANKALFLAAPVGLDIVYEDNNVIFVNKPPALAVHDFDGGGADTLINRILHYLYDKKEFDFENENSFAPALCNRIDRNTCGIVIAAKNAAALKEMNDAIKERRVIKKYLCLTHGAPEKNSGEIVLYLKKLEDENRVLVSEKPLADYKTAISLYKVISKGSGRALIEIELKTGRTHQIRASLAHLGHAIWGDGKYGKTYAADKAAGFSYQALCSYHLGFNFEPSCTLSYLNAKTFEVKDIWFKDRI